MAALKPAHVLFVQNILKNNIKRKLLVNKAKTCFFGLIKQENCEKIRRCSLPRGNRTGADFRCFCYEDITIERQSSRRQEFFS